MPVPLLLILMFLSIILASACLTADVCTIHFHWCTPQMSLKDQEDELRKQQSKYGVDGEQHEKPKK